MYNVTQMSTPTVIFVGKDATLASPSDVEKLKPLIKHLRYFEEISNWNHFDFVIGIDAEKLLYPKLIKMLEDTAVGV